MGYIFSVVFMATRSELGDPEYYWATHYITFDSCVASLWLPASFFLSFSKIRLTSVAGYCTTAQALADYAAVIADLQGRSRDRSAVVVFGGSYGGPRFLQWDMRKKEVNKWINTRIEQKSNMFQNVKKLTLF